MSDKIDQKTKVGQNTRFFLRFFFPSSFRPPEAEKKFVGWVGGGENDSSVISLVKESRLLTFS